MKKIENDGFTTIKTKVGAANGWRMLLALALLISGLVAALPAQLVLADAGGVKGHTFDVTFTKWITAYPKMAGVDGGAVGNGTFAGEILNLSSSGSITSIEALYHMSGTKHSFTAHVFVREDDSVGQATITGRVIDGWQEGASVTGKYKVWVNSCPIPTPGNSVGTTCFQGTLYILAGSDE
jgi:hypothetical protein